MNALTANPAEGTENGILALLQSKDFAEKVGSVLPKHITTERMIRMMFLAMRKTPKLLKCTPASIQEAMMVASSYGIEPDGRRAHLIPYEQRMKVRGQWTSVLVCQLQLDYKGIAELVMRSGLVSHISADVVREGDLFKFSKGRLEEHIPWFIRRDRDRPENAGIRYAAYSLVVMKDGTERVEVMSNTDILSIRDRSQGWKAFNSGAVKQSPWNPEEEVIESEMWKKGLALDTPIPTPDGWTTMGEIKVGDVVFDMDGKQTNVIGVSEVKNIDCFELTFSNGEKIVCDNEHLWCAAFGPSAHKQRAHGWPVLTINELYELKQKGVAISIPVAGALEGDWSDIEVDPYVLGYWLGNGTTADGCVTTNRSDFDNVRERVGKHFSIGAVYEERGHATTFGIKGLKVALREIGVLNNKHIPQKYLRLPQEQRIALLQGLMDSDGHLAKERGKAMFASTREVLARGFYELVRSLGQAARIVKRKSVGFGKVCEYWSVEWQPSFNPCFSERKAENFRDRKLSVYQAVQSIVKVDSVPTRCIGVDSETRTYLCSKSMIPTHNTTFKRLSKWLPLSAEIRDLLEREDSLEFPDTHSGVVNASTFSNITAGLSELAANLENEPIEDTPNSGETTKDESASTATVTKPVATSKRASAKKPEVSEEFAIWKAEIEGCEDANIAANIRAEIDVGNDKLTDPEKDQLIALIDAKFPPKE